MLEFNTRAQKKKIGKTKKRFLHISIRYQIRSDRSVGFTELDFSVVLVDRYDVSRVLEWNGMEWRSLYFVQGFDSVFVSA